MPSRPLTAMGCLFGALALAPYALRHLASDPLTEVERARGRAVRIVACVRADDADLEAAPSGFVWTALVFTRGDLIESAPKLARSTRIAARVIGSLSGVGGARMQKLSGTVIDLAAMGSDPAEPPEPIEPIKPDDIGTRSLPAKPVKLPPPTPYADPWRVAEYAIALPRLVRSFTFKSGPASCHVDRDRRNALINRHYEDIRNAAADTDAYPAWLAQHLEQVARLETPTEGPLVSIVCPVFRTPPAYLRAAIDSIVAQTYATWELVLVNASPDDAGVAEVLAGYRDEARIRVVECPENRGIAGNTNVGIAHARGEYVCFFDHDDLVEPQALGCMMAAVQAGAASGEPVDLVYCDEDSVDETGAHGMVLFKPGRNVDLLYSNNYAIHWLMVSRYVLDRTARSADDVNGAQDYDLTLKAFEVGRGVARVPYVLYHWRIHSGSTNCNPGSKNYAQEAGRLAIEQHLERRGLAAQVTREERPFTYRATFQLERAWPDIFCISVGDPAPELMRTFEAYALAHPGATADTVRSYSLRSSASEISNALWRIPGRLALVATEGVSLSPEDLELAVGYFERPEVFAVSPRLLFEHGLVDYAGALVAPDGTLVKLGHGLPTADEGYIGRLHRPYSAAVLNADCMFVNIETMFKLGFPKGYLLPTSMLADVCLRAYARGFVNVYTPFATARWTVPRSLAVDDPYANPYDANRLVRMHGDEFAHGDPSHNPNFDPTSRHYRLRDFPTAG